MEVVPITLTHLGDTQGQGWFTFNRAIAIIYPSKQTSKEMIGDGLSAN
jgi:hypothetical protein